MALNLVKLWLISVWLCYIKPSHRECKEAYDAYNILGILIMICQCFRKWKRHFIWCRGASSITVLEFQFRQYKTERVCAVQHLSQLCRFTELDCLKYSTICRYTEYVLRSVKIKYAVSLCSTFTMCITYAVPMHPYWNEWSTSADWLHMCCKIWRSNECGLQYELHWPQYKEQSAYYWTTWNESPIGDECTAASKYCRSDSVYYAVQSQK